MCILDCVHANTFLRKKDGVLCTTLFVPVGQQVYGVYVEGDLSACAGQQIICDLFMFDGQLRLRFREVYIGKGV